MKGSKDAAREPEQGYGSAAGNQPRNPSALQDQEGLTHPVTHTHRVMMVTFDMANLVGRSEGAQRRSQRDTANEGGHRSRLECFHGGGSNQQMNANISRSVNCSVSR